MKYIQTSEVSEVLFGVSAHGKFFILFAKQQCVGSRCPRNRPASFFTWSGIVNQNLLLLEKIHIRNGLILSIKIILNDNINIFQYILLNFRASFICHLTLLKEQRDADVRRQTRMSSFFRKSAKYF